MNRKKIKKTCFYVLITLASLIWLIPVFSLLITSLRPQVDFYSGKSMLSFPENPQWSNFSNAWVKGKLGNYMTNGLIICLLKVPLGILVEAMIAFALSRLPIRHKKGLFIFFLLGMMLPHQMALIPLNVAFTRLNLVNNYFGLFYVYVGFGISMGVLVLQGFMKSIPKEIDEAAYIDGCNTAQLFGRIIFPIAKPAIATLVIIDFLNTWNEFLLQSILVTKNSMRTIPNGLMAFIGENGTDYGLLSAGVLISIVPVLVVYIVFQKYFVEGIAGSVKG